MDFSVYVFRIPDLPFFFLNAYYSITFSPSPIHTHIPSRHLKRYYYQFWTPAWIYVCVYAEINWKFMTSRVDETRKGWAICIHSSCYFSYNDITIMISKNNYNSIYSTIFKSIRCSFPSCSAIVFANCHDCTNFVRSETNTFSFFLYREIIIKRHAHQNEIFKQLVHP